MCIRYESGGLEYWDNASGRNYEMEVVTRVASIEERREEDELEQEAMFTPSRAGLPQLEKLSLADEAVDHDSTSDSDASDISEPSPRRHRKQLVDHLKDVVGRAEQNGFFGVTDS
jgi:uncharacterized protein (UPF0335 family)